jgi:hypothetical protein
MSESHKVNPGRGLQLKQKGVFNLEKLYDEMRSWVDENKYSFNEKEHTEKHGDKGKEIVLVWEVEREITDYLMYEIKVNFLLKGINKVSEGLVSGFVKITFTANVVSDYKNKFGKSKFSEWLSKLYKEYLIKSEIKRHQDKLQKELTDFQDITKEVLEFHR